MRFCRSWGSNYIRADLPRHFLQRGKLFFVDQIKLGDKVIEMFVAGIYVWLGSNAHDPVEVVDINMNKNSVEPSQNFLALWLETLRERDICCDWKQLLVINLRLDPIHQQRDILGSWKMNWFLVLHPILP